MPRASGPCSHIAVASVHGVVTSTTVVANPLVTRRQSHLAPGQEINMQRRVYVIRETNATSSTSLTECSVSGTTNGYRAGSEPNSLEP